jgi:preprotein translocase subunit SecE
MASVTKGDEENKATAEADGDGEGSGAKAYTAGDKLAKAPRADKEKGDPKAVEYARPSTPGSVARRGYFTIYKRGQGYWTRMGTIIGAGVLGLMFAYTLYDRTRTFFLQDPHFGNRVAIGVAIGFMALYGLLVWHLTNKPANVDFLVATDSEMKKVNWTSRKELIGSTKVVIFFMFMIAVILFVIDIIFSWLMYLIGVLHNNPFSGGGTIGGG